jgi:hypothetical protein
MKRQCLVCNKEFSAGVGLERGSSSVTCSDKCSYIHKLKYNYLWQKNNPRKVLEHKRKSRTKIKFRIFELLGRKCNNCNFSDWRALQIDHVKGNGKQDRLKFGDSGSYYLHILKEIEKGSKEYQLLCANCNWIKRWERKEQSQTKYGGRVY